MLFTRDAELLTTQGKDFYITCKSNCNMQGSLEENLEV